MKSEPTLLQVVLDPKSKRLEAVVRHGKKFRKIRLEWRSKDPRPMPPHWWVDIVDECDFQSAQSSNDPRIVFQKIRNGG